MSKLIMVSVLGMLLAGSGPALAAAEGGPKIVVEKMRYEHGVAKQGNSVSHVFEIRNGGTETLVIERVQTS